jgi:hypothetical protein
MKRCWVRPRRAMGLPNQTVRGNVPLSGHRPCHVGDRNLRAAPFVLEQGRHGEPGSTSRLPNPKHPRQHGVGLFGSRCKATTSTARTSQRKKRRRPSSTKTLMTRTTSIPTRMASPAHCFRHPQIRRRRRQTTRPPRRKLTPPTKLRKNDGQPGERHGSKMKTVRRPRKSLPR